MPVRWIPKFVVLALLAPTPALAHVGVVFGAGGGLRLGGVLYVIGGAYAAVLVVCVLSFFLRSRALFWVALTLAVLALAGAGFLLFNLIGLGGPIAMIPLGLAFLNLALVILGRWRHSRRAASRARPPPPGSAGGGE